MPPHRVLKSIPLLISAALALPALLTSVIHATFRSELSYNEGWNVYNAAALTRHLTLYPSGYHWTTNNYPAISFVVSAALHPLTHDYLFTARTISLLSLIVLSVLVGLILRELNLAPTACLLAALFCLGIFPANTAQAANAPYIGVDEPQMLALAVFALGLWLYIRVRSKPSFAELLLVAAVLTLGGSIKHTSIDIPIAIFLDLTLLHWRRALAFALCMAACIALSVEAHLHFGGPGFLTQFLLPRVYESNRAWELMLDFYLPLIPPILIALFTAVRNLRNANLRLLYLLSATSLLTSIWFSSAQGVSVNCFFDSLFAICLWIGVFCHQIATSGLSSRTRTLLMALPALSLLVPLTVYNMWNPIAIVRASRNDQAGFDRDVAYLRAQPGPVLCEDLLRCVYAGKPYLYDPFNATRLIRLHRLDERPLLDQLNHHAFAAIELREPLDREAIDNLERFQPEVLTAIARNYHLAYQRGPECIYIPDAPTVPGTETHTPAPTTVASNASRTPQASASTVARMPRGISPASRKPS